MEEREPEFSTHEVFSGQSAGEDVPSSCSIESLFDDILKDGHTCTHKHTCNPPGPDLSHTHTCFHVHTKILSASPGETAESPEKSFSTKRRSCTNREAVRKYREKKKAHAASLEEEVAHLRAINQQLMKRIRGQAALEAEIGRLKCLLVDLRGRIEGEIGSFPYQKNATQTSMLGAGAQVLNSCSFHCDDQAYCHYAGMQGKNLGDQSEAGHTQCMACSASGYGDFRSSGNGTAGPADRSPNDT